METRGNSSQVEIGCMFKSYYVVWKRPSAKIRPLRSARLNRTMQYGNCCISWRISAQDMFKSYYVVWKPHQYHLLFSFGERLNRTMQYGNHLLPFKMWRKYVCLNRTMQYGNFLLRFFFFFCFQSLNRTMQYGNSAKQKLRGLQRIGFKSYYVVWKLFSDE